MKRSDRDIRGSRGRLKFDVALNTDSLPQFKIQQPPNTIAMVAVSRAMFGKNPRNCIGPE